MCSCYREKSKTKQKKDSTLELSLLRVFSSIFWGEGPLKYFVNCFTADLILFRETKGVNCRLQVCELLF